MTDQPPNPSDGAPSRATLPRDLGEFLIELSIALNKFSMYPSDHPSLQPAAVVLVTRLDRLLEERGTLSVGVARHQLVIEGVATDAKNPVLKDLADRLHGHHLGAVTFARGVGPGEVLDFLRNVSLEPDRMPEGLGLLAREVAWPHVRIFPLLYDRLDLVEERPESTAAAEDAAARSKRTRAAQLWLGMARAALATEGTGELTDAERHSAAQETGEEDPAPTDPTLVARAIEDNPRGTAYDQVIVGYMLQIAEEVRSAKGQEATQLKRRVSKLVSTLDQGTLGRLLEMGGDGIQRRKFLLDASQGMAVDAVVELVQAAGKQQEQTISDSMLRLLQKLARHADVDGAGGGELAERSVRDQVAKLIGGWSLQDPNPDAYRRVLEGLSGSDLSTFTMTAEADRLPEPRRIVEMALEVDATGDALSRAVNHLLEHGEVTWLIQSVTAAGKSSVVDSIWTRLATPERWYETLRSEPLDVDLIDALLPRFGEEAIGPMLDALGELQSSKGRRILLDRLGRLGPRVGIEAAARLNDDRWYVLRNMLKIIGDLETIPSGLVALDFLRHADVRVRREALRVLVQDPAHRVVAIGEGLASSDERMVRAALAAAFQDLPPSAIPLVQSRALAGGEDVRLAAIRVLGASGAAQALETLLTLTAPRRTFLGARPPAKSAEYLAALAALRGFEKDPRARQVLAHAAGSKDPDIAQAARGARAPQA